MMLPKNQFNNIIRWINTGSVDRAISIRQASFTALKRLGVPRNEAKAVTGIPNGSDQFDSGSLVTWMQKIKPENKRAIWQLQAIDATAVKRS